jgi:hypothetical protein
MAARFVTLLQTQNGDLDFTQGLRLTTTLAQFVAQRVRSRLLFFLGEWFLDTRQGVPYFLQVFVSNPDIPLVTSLFRRVIEETPGVASLETFQVAFIRTSRVLRVTAKIRASDGSLVPINVPLIIPIGVA